jgi:hypothetical protein
LAEILLIVLGNTHDRNQQQQHQQQQQQQQQHQQQQQQQHLSSSASSEQLSLLSMFQTAYDDIEDRRRTIR